MNADAPAIPADGAPSQDAALMGLVAKGDLDAFEALFNRYKGPLAGFFYRLCRDWQGAEDLIQETFLRIWKSAACYRGTGAFSTYLFQIAKNLWLNELRRAASRPRPPVGDVQEMPDPDDPRPGPDGRAEKRERHAQVHAAVARLTEKKRLVVELVEFQGLRYRDVARILKIPVGTVKSRMSAAEKDLREMLEPYLGS